MRRIKTISLIFVFCIQLFVKAEPGFGLFHPQRRVARQAVPNCAQDPSRMPAEMPQCFCCQCSGVSPICKSPGPPTIRPLVTTRSTPRTTKKTTPKPTTPKTLPPITVACIDSQTSCGTWVRNGFCTNSAYTPAQRQQYCARSCSLCGKKI